MSRTEGFTADGRTFGTQYVSVVGKRDGMALEIIDDETDEIAIEVFRHDDLKKYSISVAPNTPLELVESVLKFARSDDWFLRFVD